MTITSAEAEREVESSRGELDRTVEALKGKMTPGELFREARRATGGAGEQLIARIIDQAKENPMPFAVMGMGLAWWASSAKERRGGATTHAWREPRAFTESSGPSLGETMADKARDFSDRTHGAADRVSQGMQSAGDKASEMVRQARDSLSDAKDRASAMAANAGQKAQDMAGRTRQAASDLIDREPLLIGALGFVVGLALGAVAPSTDEEKRAVAPVKDNLADKTKVLAQDSLETVRDTASAVYGGVKEELTRPDGGDIAQKAENAARTGARAARQQTASTDS